MVIFIRLQANEVDRDLHRAFGVVGVETVDLVQHVGEELVAAFENTDGMERLPAIGQHVVESITSKFFYSVLDHSVGDENITNRVFIVVWDTKKVGIVA